ncbi:MAG TPA: hydroxylase [Chloroflexi bacterium]|nr:hydroxylase [Chloroflexota bacterium]|tara:strand:+ start:803 stop:1132 length:330 start_codon:yes stop_codon:yes gene_type:complete
MNNKTNTENKQVTPTSETVRDALREVMDPELGMNVVELGLIREVVLENNKLSITMILTTPFCPYGPALIESVRDTASAHSSMTTTVEMGTEMWTPEMMEEGAGGDWGLF